METYTTSSSGTEAVWYYWNGSTTSSATTTVWEYWNDDSTGGTITTNNAQLWVRWNGEVADYEPLVVVEPRTVEQEREFAARLARELAEAQAKAQELARLAREADERAEALLQAFLNETQREEFQKDKSFTVISKDGERHYRIKKGFSRNIERLDKDGKRIRTLCGHPAAQLPDYDHMLAQKLMLEHAEEEFLQIANAS